MKHYFLITGSRNATESDRAAIVETMCCFKESPAQFVHGGCKGADSIAAEYVRKWGHEEKVFLPDRGNWPKAGPERNQRMVEYVKQMASNNHVPVCIAFLKPGFDNKGALGCIGMALKAGFRLDINVLEA